MARQTNVHNILVINCLCCLFIAQATPGQDPRIPVSLSIPDLTATPGQTLEVPVEISDVTSLNISSTDLLITYDARIVTADRPLINNTLTDRWTEAHRVGFVEGSQDTMGLIDIALATANRIPSGSGTFLNVRFVVSDSARIGQVSSLVLAEAILNNRSPQTTTQNGSITIVGQNILIGDFNGDCIVNFQDFILFASHFGSSEGDPRYDPAFDLNSDGQIGFADFLAFLTHFGDTCA